MAHDLRNRDSFRKILLTRKKSTGGSIKAFSNLASFRGEAKFSTWLVQITYNEAKMRLRKAHSHLYESIDDQQQSEEGDFWPRDYADWRPISSELLEQNEVRQAVQNALNSLRPIHREVLVLGTSSS